MICSLKLYHPKWEKAVRSFTLDETQKDFVLLPDAFLDRALQDEACLCVVIMREEDPVGFFILHQSEEVRDFTQTEKAIFFRGFSINREYQGRGYASSALQQLPDFLNKHDPHMREVILTVNERNASAIRLYEKIGFEHLGKSKLGRCGLELGMKLVLS